MKKNDSVKSRRNYRRRKKDFFTIIVRRLGTLSILTMVGFLGGNYTYNAVHKAKYTVASRNENQSGTYTKHSKADIKIEKASSVTSTKDVTSNIPQTGETENKPVQPPQSAPVQSSPAKDQNILIKEDNKNSLEVRVEDAYKKDGIKTVFLTFDDGPGKESTPQVLKILDKYHVKATFFVIGKMAEENPELLKMIYTDGHAIGSHSYTHDYSILYSSEASFTKELDETDNVFKNVLGQDFTTRLFRFPGGSASSFKQPFKKVLYDKAYQYIDWNALNGDAEGQNIPAENLLKRLKETIEGKEDAVVLMHDTAAKQTTIQALPAAIEYLQQKGYQFRILK